LTPSSVAAAHDGAAISYTLHACEKAGAPRLVLVHSLALDRSVWDGVVAELAAEVDVLVYDCRGHGASARTPGPYSVRLFAGDLADLLRHVGWTSAIVAGASMGGSVALQFAIDHPSSVEALGAIDTTAWYGPKAPESWRERGDKAQREGLESLIAFQLTRWFSDGFNAAHPEVGEHFKRVFLQNDLDAYVATCAMLGALNVSADLGAITAPTEIVVGDEDYATPPEMARALHAGIAGSQLTILPGARHLTPVEVPGIIASHLRALMARAKG
jgi:3-oxoadipate enol-lactonase